MLHALLSSTAHRYDITDLEAGTAIYARVGGHTLMSYGYTALSDPEFETPSNVQPGAPAAVRLWASSDSSITVHWDHPTVDGGTKYGYVDSYVIDVPQLNTAVLGNGEITLCCFSGTTYERSLKQCVIAERSTYTARGTQEEATNATKHVRVVSYGATVVAIRHELVCVDVELLHIIATPTCTPIIWA